MARDAIARQFDVDKHSVKLNQHAGTITFFAKTGESIYVEKLFASFQATRMAGRTGNTLVSLILVASGEAVVVDKDIILKVAGTAQRFVLSDYSKLQLPEHEKTAYQRLQESLASGPQQVQVTGHVAGWNGHFPEFLKTLPGTVAKDPDDPDKPGTRKPMLLVTGFQVIDK